RLELPTSDDDYRLPAAISVGTNPTFDGHERRVEAYALDRDDLELYDQMVGAEFVRLLRPTVRFDSVESLVAQMTADVEASRAVLGAAAPSSVSGSSSRSADTDAQHRTGFGG